MHVELGYQPVASADMSICITWVLHELLKCAGGRPDKADKACMHVC